jgi:hypothetical protein
MARTRKNKRRLPMDDLRRTARMAHANSQSVGRRRKIRAAGIHAYHHQPHDTKAKLKPGMAGRARMVPAVL